MGFDPCNYALKIWDAIWDFWLSTWEFTWECEGSFPHTLCTPRSMWCDSRVFLLAHNLATPCLDREPKAKVATLGVGPRNKQVKVCPFVKTIVSQEN
jgi:hypothetical protein